ncbi:MAG TPA: carbohydrate ABC transporter permease [Streptosporangiaceae bacterium]|nr:carbohydrate ABC transporter permease [Streptosporangiaceae bacterium]
MTDSRTRPARPARSGTAGAPTGAERPAAAPHRAARRGRGGRRHQADELFPRPAGIAVRVLATLFVAVPVVYMVILSVSPEVDVSAGHLIPHVLDLSNYASIWADSDLLRGFVNSIVICGIAAAVAVVVATAGAYPLARYRFRGSGPMLYGALGLQLIPGPMLLLPLFVVFSILQVTVGLTVIGSYWGIMIAYVTFSLPLAVWLMLGYIRTIPRELEEAAWVDGASRARAVRLIVAPLAVPGMVVAFVFSLLVGWNDVLFASVLTTPSTRTVAVDLQVFTLTMEGQSLPQYAQLMAAGVVASVPVVVAYLLLQKYLVGGRAAGALK